MLIQTIKLYEWNDSVYLTVYLPSVLLNNESARRPAVIICPGGGYVSHSENEMEPVALQFLAAGYCPFVLNHSIGAPFSKFPTPIVELAKSVHLVRQHAQQWCILPKQIFVCGFSTGGHTAALLGTTWNQPYLTDILGVDSHQIRPDAMILSYPILNLHDFSEKRNQFMPEMASTIEMMFLSILDSGKPSVEDLNQWNPVTHASNMTIPAFIWSTAEDKLVPKKSMYAFLEALEEFHVPHEFHLFKKGGHGIACASDLSNTKQWFSMANCWIKDISND